MRLGTLRRAGFDHIRVDRALHQKRRIAQVVRGLLKEADKGLTDDPAFLLRGGDPFQTVKEILNCMDGLQVGAEVLPKGLFNPQSLVLAHQAGIHKDR